MAGLSARFFDAGYDKPKYMLPGHGQPLFDHAVRSFQEYFSTLPFVFIVRDIHNTPSFVRKQCAHLAIKNYSVVVLQEETRGQAETVFLGLKDANESEPLTVFNIDTFRPGFVLPDASHHSDGYLEVFKGEGQNWSYAKPASASSDRVIETAEKNPISDLCSTGLYHFSEVKSFKMAYEFEQQKPLAELKNKELYIAPLYNHLIQLGQDIRYHLIARDEVIFCGVPKEYEDFLKSA